MVMKPAWLQGLIGETFFQVCGSHTNRRKNEKNIFCLNCCRSICPHCLPSHRSHALIQVRRYVYHDVVRLAELEKLIECSYIQPYTINNAKVVFLNQRAQSRQYRGHTNFCLTCDRILQEPFHFCSLSCKVDHVVLQGGDLSSILCRFDESDFAFSQFEELRMESSGAMEEDEEEEEVNLHCSGGGGYSILDQFKASSCSSDLRRSNSSSLSSVVSQDSKKKKVGFFPGIVMSLSRRKGAPQRSPLS